ncbi:MAG: serine/threonine protein kinase [Myxococcales bacterium]|nr:serine/threonine protein kinase [Myxococcales bacterium]MCB9583065.1 serine/threonine protein kinase [Polyangiaceae bacterium]
MADPRQSRKSSKSGEKSTDVSDAERLPRPFGRLMLLRQLARGGMGEVYLASAGGIEGAERPCVVKIIRREHADDKSFLARFLDEARIQAQLQHPGVAQILEAAKDEEGKPFVVVEHVEGRNLGEIRNRAQQLGARVAWPEAVALGVAMADALAHVHERTDAAGRPLEIVHRDLSPQNVMVSYGGDIKLIDFGTARGENRRCHTVAGIVFAKPGYVAPEVANNTPGGVPADIYAFGVMLWELLAGRRFLSGDAAEHLAAVGQGRRSPSPIAQLVDGPGELDSVIAKLTATKLGERYGSAREALNDLVQVLKRAPSLADGERSVRARISQLMNRLYPSEPARTRIEFQKLVALARKRKPRLVLPVPSPTPAPTTGAEDSTLLPGTRYRPLRSIGRGAMGEVHEALHVDLGRTVALKLLENDSASVAAAERLRAEARTIARLEHENLVTLHDFGFTSDGRPFYAMELLTGESLDRFVERERTMPIKHALRVGIEACRALTVAHAAGVVHRDIKPGNLFQTKNGTVKLLDFGVAKQNNTIEQEGGGLSLVGTLEYMAPEQARGEAGDARSDIYALGAVLYELLTGRLPHVASTPIALIDAKNKNPVEAPSVRAKQRGLSKMVDKTILRALDKDPDKRFESAEEMRAALEAALREPEMRRRRRRRFGFAAIGVITLALGAGVAVGATKPDVRARALASVQPLVQKIQSLRGQKSEAVAAAVVAPAPEAAPAEEPVPAVDEVEEAEPAAANETEDEAAPAEEVAAADADEGSTDDGEAQADSAESADQADAPEQAEPEQKTAEFAAEPVSETPASEEIESKITEAQDMMKNGQKVKGFNQLRRLGKNHRKDKRVLEAWCTAAIQMKGWGEAYRVARQWASVDRSPEARIQLARMERAVGKREHAIHTLTALLQERPGHEEARHMLRSLTGDAKVAQR